MSQSHEECLNPSQAAARLRTCSIPRGPIQVVERLQQAGFAAVFVGGSVRDLLRNAEVYDFDVATSAKPEQVQALFRRTIPTGIAHGTITVLARGPGEPQLAVEVTTFRGEGAYQDGRHPSQVQFLQSLEGDLERRDFTINAFAWDPVGQVFTDLFGGLADLEAGLIRAIFEPSRRFGEDGLRILRALRFCGQFGFRIEERTLAAIPGALPVLARVSRERVFAELGKMLTSPHLALSLEPMLATDTWPLVLGLVDRPEDVRLAITAATALEPRLELRLARLLLPLQAARGMEAVTAVLDALKVSQKLRKYIAAVLSPWAVQVTSVADPAGIRAAAAQLGREYVDDVLALYEASPLQQQRVRESCEAAALTLAELAISAAELLAAGVVQPGPKMGEVLRFLLAEVLGEPGLNHPQTLLERARYYVSK